MMCNLNFEKKSVMYCVNKFSLLYSITSKLNINENCKFIKLKCVGNGFP